MISGSCDDWSRGIEPAIYSKGIKLLGRLSFRSYAAMELLPRSYNDRPKSRNTAVDVKAKAVDLLAKTFDDELRR